MTRKGALRGGAALVALLGGLGRASMQPAARADDQPYCVPMFWYSVCSYPDNTWKICNFHLDNQCEPGPPPAGPIPGLPAPPGVVSAPPAPGPPPT